MPEEPCGFRPGRRTSLYVRQAVSTRVYILEGGRHIHIYLYLSIYIYIVSRSQSMGWYPFATLALGSLSIFKVCVSR